MAEKINSLKKITLSSENEPVITISLENFENPNLSSLKIENDIKTRKCSINFKTISSNRNDSSFSKMNNKKEPKDSLKVESNKNNEIILVPGKSTQIIKSETRLSDEDLIRKSKEKIQLKKMLSNYPKTLTKKSAMAGIYENCKKNKKESVEELNFISFKDVNAFFF